MPVNKEVFEVCSTFEFTPAQKDWIAALRSGNYIQAKGYLQTTYGFCCLGVGAIRAKNAGRSVRVSPLGYHLLIGDSLSDQPKVKEYLGLRMDTGDACKSYMFRGEDLNSSLAYLNDDMDATFSEIADVLEQNPEAFFECSEADLTLAYARDFLPIAEELADVSLQLKKIIKMAKALS